MTNPVVQARRVINGGVGGTPITKHFYWCPGCKAMHGIGINPDKQANGAGWDFDGNFEKPTYAPSQLTRWNTPTGEFVCHTFIRQGMIEFLGDCTHELKGQTVPLPPLPDWFVKTPNEEC